MRERELMRYGLFGIFMSLFLEDKMFSRVERNHRCGGDTALVVSGFVLLSWRPLERR